MSKSNIHAGLDKANPSDHNLELKSIWAADVSRPWETYSRESFRRFWDTRDSVDQKR